MIHVAESRAPGWNYGIPSGFGLENCPSDGSVSQPEGRHTSFVGHTRWPTHQAVTVRWRLFHVHRPASNPTAISPRTTELGSGTAWRTPKRPFASSWGPAEK